MLVLSGVFTTRILGATNYANQDNRHVNYIIYICLHDALSNRQPIKKWLTISPRFTRMASADWPLSTKHPNLPQLDQWLKAKRLCGREKPLRAECTGEQAAPMVYRRNLCKYRPRRCLFTTTSLTSIYSISHSSDFSYPF
jgi:hypothetical protein